MENNYLISVIIPVHNTAGYLRKCVESVRNQSLKSIEIILVENLSSDNSAEICDEYVRLDKRIRVLHLQEAGLSIARNAGLKIAYAPYVGFIDSDDFVEPTMFQEMLDALVNYEADFVYCNYVFDYEGKESIYPFRDSGLVEIYPLRDFLRDMMWEKISCSFCTKLFRKDFFDTHEFPVGRLYEDRLVMHEWVLACNRIVWLDKSFYHYVERFDSICHTIVPINRYHFFLSQYERLEFINQHSLFEGKELYDVRTMIIRICLSIFKEIMLRVKPSDFREPFEDMRQKFKKILSLKEGEIDVRCRKRMKGIVYNWPIYNLIHFAFKRKKYSLIIL